MISKTVPPLPPRPQLRPSPLPHVAQPVGQQPRKFPGPKGIVADRLAGIMQNATGCQSVTIRAMKTKTEKEPLEQSVTTSPMKTKTEKESLELNKENRDIPLETAVELLGIKKEEEESTQDDKENRNDVGEAAHDECSMHVLPEKPARVGEQVGAQPILEGLKIKTEEFENMIAQLEESWSIGANGLIGMLVPPPPLPLRTGSTYTTVTRICSGKYLSNQPRENRPLPALPKPKQTTISAGNAGYVINSNTEYLEAVASHYNQTFGKMGKIFIKIHGIDKLSLPTESTKDTASIGVVRNGGEHVDKYVYLILECDGKPVCSKRVTADSGSVCIGEEFALPVQAGCNLIVQLSMISHPSSNQSSGYGVHANHPVDFRIQNLVGKSSGETSKWASTENLTSETESSAYSMPRMETFASSISSAGEPLGQTGFTLDSHVLANFSTPKSTAGFHLCWEMSRQFLGSQEQAKLTAHEQKNVSHGLRKQWQKLKKHSMISSSIGVSTINGTEADVPLTPEKKDVVVGNVKASVVVWPYPGEWAPSGFDECVRMLTGDGLPNLNRLIKGWAAHGKDWIIQNPETDLTGILEAASVLGNFLILGKASVRIAESLYWKRRSFALHPPHLLILPISDQPPTHIHQAFDLRLCIAIEAPFDTPIQDIQDGLWHPITNAFRMCFKKSALDFKDEETVEISVDSLEMANEWVTSLRNMVGRLQSI